MRIRFAAIALWAGTLPLPSLAQSVPANPPPGAAPQAPSPIAPDRPGFTNSSGTVQPGRTQIESGFAQTRDQAANGGVLTDDLPESLVRVGLTSALEARVILPDYNSAPGAHGFGDGALGFKYRVYQNKSGTTLAAITPSVTVPVHGQYSSGQYDPSVTFAAQTASGSRWNLATNLVTSDPTQNGRRIFTVTPSASVSYALTSALGVYGDAYDTIPRLGAPSPVADGGLTYLIGGNVQLDAETYYGLGGRAFVRSLNGGVSFRF